MDYLQLFSNAGIQKEFKWSEEGEEVTTIPLTKVNIVIGANNSRKSRFLRYLMEQDNFAILSESVTSSLKELKEVIDTGLIDGYEIEISKDVTVENNLYINRVKNELESAKRYVQAGYNPKLSFDVKYLEELYEFITDFFRKPTEHSPDNFTKRINEFNSILSVINSYETFSIKVNKLPYDPKTALSGIFKVNPVAQYHNNNLYLIRNILKNLYHVKITEETPPKATYIPTLRGAVHLINDSQNPSKIYEYTIRKNYPNLPKKINIFTGLDLYDRIKKVRNGRKKDRIKFDDFEEFLSTNFFDNQEIDIVALEEESHIQLYVNNEDREMFNVGDGIQSLIILMYPIFTANDGEWIFIEEPELNMHPGLQTLFLKTITENEVITKKNLRIFITTHSNHLLNLTLREQDNTSILSFQKIGDGDDNYTLIRQLFGPDMKVLDILGVENSSVFLSNCTLWVEGVSDRKYIKAFLIAYIKDNDLPEFQEDLHFSFFEYAGSNLSHYLFSDEGDDEIEEIKAHFLSNRIYLLADKDSGKDNKHKTFEKMKNHYFRYSHTGVIEVENLLSVQILKSIFKDVLSIDNSIIENLNFDESSYKEVGLGKFISEKLKGKAPVLRKDEKSKTLKTYYKNKFSDYVLSKVKKGEITWDMIAENSWAKTITKNIYKFISDHNKKEK